jgi:hypothetical protein
MLNSTLYFHKMVVGLPMFTWWGYRMGWVTEIVRNSDTEMVELPNIMLSILTILITNNTVIILDDN